MPKITGKPSVQVYIFALKFGEAESNLFPPTLVRNPPFVAFNAVPSPNYAIILI
jgi:hypothetical protein